MAAAVGPTLPAHFQSVHGALRSSYPNQDAYAWWQANLPRNEEDKGLQFHTACNKTLSVVNAMTEAEFSGAAALFGFFHAGRLYIANAGDCSLCQIRFSETAVTATLLNGWHNTGSGERIKSKYYGSDLTLNLCRSLGDCDYERAPVEFEFNQFPAGTKDDAASTVYLCFSDGFVERFIEMSGDLKAAQDKLALLFQLWMTYERGEFEGHPLTPEQIVAAAQRLPILGTPGLSDDTSLMAFSPPTEDAFFAVLDGHGPEGHTLAAQVKRVFEEEVMAAFHLSSGQLKLGLENATPAYPQMLPRAARLRSDAEDFGSEPTPFAACPKSPSPSKDPSL